MAKRKPTGKVAVVEKENVITSATIHGMQFTITNTKHTQNSKREGRMKFSLSYDDGKLVTTHVTMNLTACWIDPNTNNCIEAFAAHDSKIKGYNDGVAELKRVIGAIPTIRVTSETGFTVTALCDCFRYAMKYEAGEYASDNELYEKVEYFKSKHSAIMRVLGILERYNAVGGFESANLNLVSDRLLESVGFFKVIDSMSDGSQSPAPPYWGANMSEMFIVNNMSSGARANYRDRDVEVTKMAVMFADKLRKEIESVGV